MKKTYCFLFGFLMAISTSFAQPKKSLPLEEIKDGDYTIRLLPAPGNTYGFDILKGEKVITHQQFSPFHSKKRMEGLQKEDVVKVTKYLLQEARKTGGVPAPLLPDVIAQRLNIKL